LVVAARAAGYRGLVLKSHVEGTTSRARLLRDHDWPEGEVHGGLVLNHEVCGGLNPSAVATQLALGARVIWLPTLSSMANKGQAVRLTPAPTSINTPPIGFGPEDTALGRPLALILTLIAEHDAVLATGHLTPPEIMLVVPFAHSLGVRRIAVTHPELPIIGLSIQDQLSLAEIPGVWFERCFIATTSPFGVPLQEITDSIRKVGVARTILATDLGQPGNPDPITGMAHYLANLGAAGLPWDELEEMVTLNPARLLGVHSSVDRGSHGPSDPR
jgi:hypothetical protein